MSTKQPTTNTPSSKTVDVHRWRQQLLTLASLQAQLENFEQRASSLHSQLEQSLAQQHVALKQQDALHTTRNRTQAHAQHATDLEHQLDACHRRLVTTRAVVQEQTQALVRGCHTLQEAHGRLAAAKRELASSGVAQWRAARDRLVARRCALASTLADIFCIGPKIVSEAPPGGYLDEKMDWTWWAGGGGTSHSDDESVNSSLGVTSASTPRPSSSYAGGRQVAKMVICDLELPTSLGKRMHPDDLATARGQWEAAHTAAALGYVAQCVERLGVYLGVGTRYPVELLGSRSSMMDAAPAMAQQTSNTAGTADDPNHTTTAANVAALHPLLATSQVWEVQSEPWLTPGGAQDHPDDSPRSTTPQPGNGTGAVVPTANRFPLFFDGTEPTRFAYGTFLLSKDIEQLLVVHGLSPVGPTQLLHNLHKLLMLAKSVARSGRGAGWHAEVGDASPYGR